ncbi:AAA family ATPase [Streptococcus suis]|uniref:AAA family ATPase n=1 Tax=Streptococcus suis TaxID=1307 RepID=A0A4T2H5F7_STRSU|nr:Rep family protein [Streptococcus suis]MBY4633684.1 AAA family ATPase [Streptococcus suis]TII07172.1 AAA family ATPase [Streptococcus suis]
MNKKEANLTAIVLVQQLEDEHWKTWKDKTALKQARDESNIRPLLEAVTDKLNKADITVKEAYGIKHDKDEVKVWNQKLMKNVIEKKSEHIHFLFKFEKGASLNRIALAVGIEPQYLEKLKSGRYGYDNCLAYLIHAKDEAKYQYRPEEVVTLLGEDYQSIYHRSMATWVKGQATKKAKETNLSVDWLVERILAGEITKENIMLTNDYYAIYGRHKQKVNEAIETAGEQKSYQTISELKMGKFKKTIFFITAPSGAGKTRFAKELIEILQQVALKFGQRWDYSLTASTNAFDDYNGQEILFLDDIRGSSMTVSDWLKLLDPYMISPISARYHNKIGSAKVIIITSTKKPVRFFGIAKENNNEDSGQFVRRIDYLVTIDKSCGLSHPQRSAPQTDDFIDTWQKRIFHSFEFDKPKSHTKNQALDILVKTVIKNMQWNKPKKVINASDQTNNDNPLL